MVSFGLVVLLVTRFPLLCYLYTKKDSHWQQIVFNPNIEFQLLLLLLPQTVRITGIVSTLGDAVGVIKGQLHLLSMLFKRSALIADIGRN